MDHLGWCEQRLRELNSKPSLLGPVWYAGAFAIGSASGILGDKWSLGFIEETERQVSAHLTSHLDKLPEDDEKSRAIVRQMRAEEEQHGANAGRGRRGAVAGRGQTVNDSNGENYDEDSVPRLTQEIIFIRITDLSLLLAAVCIKRVGARALRTIKCKLQPRH